MSTAEDVEQAAAALRVVLAEIADPESELTASAATRHRIERAVLALGSLPPPRTCRGPAPPGT